MHFQSFSTLILLGAASAIELSNVVPDLSNPNAVQLEEGKKQTACKAMHPKVKCYKPSENKKSRMRMSVSQSWTSSASGSTITRKSRQHRTRKSRNTNARQQNRKRRVSASISKSESTSTGSSSTECRICKKHAKRGHVSISESEKRQRSKAHKKSHKGTQQRKATFLKIKPRKHRHHSRRVTLTENGESSVYALDVTKRQHCGKSAKVTAASSHSCSDSHSMHRKREECLACKKHQKRELVEGKKKSAKHGKRVHFSKSASFNRSSLSRSRSESCSAEYSISENYCKFRRIPIDKCCKKTVKEETSCSTSSSSCPPSRGCKICPGRRCRFN